MATLADYLDASAAPAAPAAPPSPAPVAVRPTSTIQRIKPTAAQMAQVQANTEADLKGVAESKRQQALAIAQQMAGHIQRNDTASASAAAAQLGALNREIQSIGGQQVPIPGASAPMAAPTPLAPSAPQTGTLADYIHLPVPAAAGTPGGPPPPLSPVAKHFMDAFNTIQNAKRDIGGRIAGGIDTAYSILPMVAGMVTQGIATPYYDLTGQQKEAPALGEQAGTKVSEFLDRPLGKALGITNQPAYQHPVGPVPGQVMAAIKDFAVNKGLTAEQISEQTKASSVLPYLSPETIRYYAKIASIALPEVVGMAAKPLVAAAREAMPTVVDTKGNVISRPSQPRPPSSKTMQQVQAQFEKKQAAERPADFGAAYTAATEPPLFKPPVQLTPDETGVYRDASVAQIPRVEVSAGFPAESAPPVAAEGAPASVGAAGVPPAMALRGSVDAALANASPELQQFVGSKDINSIHLPALETRALEEKHGVNLTVGQRLGDTQQYSSEWNRRGETPTLGQHFNEQPAQVANAFDVAKERHAPDISATADASELGQHEINALAAKDQLRREAISNAYKALQDANGGQFPIDINTLKGDVESQLAQNLKTNHLSESIKSDLKDFYSNPTFEGFEALRTNLSNEMRSSANGNARAAAYIVRQQLEKMPIFGEEAGSPQAIELKRLADNARSLNAERMNVIASNPAYKAAVGEAANAEGASAQGESLNAAKFHNKYVSSATPESIRRMKSEIPPDDIAHQAVIYGELERAKNAAVRPGGNLAPDSFASFLQKNKSGLNESLSPQAMQDVMELGLLTSKIGMPKTGTFNYSNTYSSILGDMAKQGLTSAGEAKLATMTGGASLPFTSMARQFLLKQSKDKFAEQAVNPYGGLTKD